MDQPLRVIFNAVIVCPPAPVLEYLRPFSAVLCSSTIAAPSVMNCSCDAILVVDELGSPGQRSEGEMDNSAGYVS